MPTKSEIVRRPRLASIDLLRGFFIVVMLVDHIARFPNIYDLISGRNLLWFSAAEGFVTISGLLVGYIYAHKILAKPQEVIRKLYKRAALLYVTVVALALFFIIYTVAVLREGNFVTDTFSLPTLLFQLFTLQYSFGWAEFLTHYVIFLLLAPIGLYLIAKGKSWLVFLLSCLTWVTFLWSTEDQLRYEFTASWQFVFFLGMIAGAHLLSLSAWLRNRFSKQTLQNAQYGLWGVALALFLTSSFLSYGAVMLSQTFPALSGLTSSLVQVWTPLNEGFFSWWTDKATVAPLRILFGIIIFWALFTFFQRFAVKIHTATNGLLFTFGQQPLFAYCTGAVIIFFIEKYIPSPAIPGSLFVANIIVTTVGIFITYYLTKIFTRYITTKSVKSPEFKDLVR